MTKADKEKTRQLIEVLGKQREWTVLNTAAALAFRAASSEPDATVRAALLRVAAQIQALHGAK